MIKRLPELWQQINHFILGLGGNPAQYIVEPFGRIYFLKFTGGHEAVDDGCQFATPMRAGEQMIEPTQGNGTDLALELVIIVMRTFT